jgi:hypothetical protein
VGQNSHLPQNALYRRRRWCLGGINGGITGLGSALDMVAGNIGSGVATERGEFSHIGIGGSEFLGHGGCRRGCRCWAVVSIVWWAVTC